MRKIFTFFSIIFLVNIGCVKLTKDFPEKKSYLIVVNDPQKRVSTIPDTKVKIRRVTVSNKFDSKGFVYRKSGSHFESDFYNEFLVSPQSNLLEEIQRYLDRKGLFSSVSSMNSRIEASHYVEAEFFSLYGDYKDSKNPQAVMEVNFRFFDDREGDYRMTFRKDYKKNIPIKNDSPESLVSGWNKALSEIMDEFSKDLSNR